MLDTTLTPLSQPFATQAAGTVLLHRGDAADRIVHVLQGKVMVGVMTDGSWVWSKGHFG
jgi:CRP-like cAMP-binding protein